MTDQLLLTKQLARAIAENNEAQLNELLDYTRRQRREARANQNPFKSKEEAKAYEALKRKGRLRYA